MFLLMCLKIYRLLYRHVHKVIYKQTASIQNPAVFPPLSLQNDCLCSHGKSVSKKGMGRTIGRGCPVLKLFSFTTVKSFGKSNFYKPPQFKKKTVHISGQIKISAIKPQKAE